MSARPCCLILIPFGVQKDATGKATVDFDRIYELAISPAISQAGLSPERADPGNFHATLYDVLESDYLVADLGHNTEVWYWLGIRHATRPRTTLHIHSSDVELPPHLWSLQPINYDPQPGSSFDSKQMEALRESLAERLSGLVQGSTASIDSPLGQIEGFKFPDLSQLRRQTGRHTRKIKEALAEARRTRDAKALKAVERRLHRSGDGAPDALVDLFLSYRALQEWSKMIALAERFPPSLARSTVVLEQLAFALNRRARSGDRMRALKILEDLVEASGMSSERGGLIGRIYKDLWQEALRRGHPAQTYLDRAIAAYVMGFETDWRDYYPGINAVTLLDVRGDSPSLEKKAQLLPLVRFAAEQSLESKEPDYWDYATMLEISILESNRRDAEAQLTKTIASVREAWEPQSTADNLRFLRAARRQRGVVEPFLDGIIERLEEAAH